MDLQLLIAQWSGATPPGFVRPAILDTALPRCQHRRCPRKSRSQARRDPRQSVLEVPEKARGLMS